MKTVKAMYWGRDDVLGSVLMKSFLYTDADGGELETLDIPQLAGYC